MARLAQRRVRRGVGGPVGDIRGWPGGASTGECERPGSFTSEGRSHAFRPRLPEVALLVGQSRNAMGHRVDSRVAEKIGRLNARTLEAVRRLDPKARALPGGRQRLDP